MARLLIIEDDDAQRFVASFALRKAGHEVHEAPDGPSGLEKARELRPDSIVCDVMMPGMTGYEVVSSLRADPELGNIPVILLTAMSDRKHMRQGMSAGADDYLTKPYKPDELCEAVKGVLARRQSLHEAFLNSMTQVVEGALEEQKENLGRRYEQQLAQEVNARWTRAAEASGDVHYDHAVVLQADLLGPELPGGPDAAERVKRTHQQARDTLYLFGASHVLPYGGDVLAVFAGDPNAPSTPIEVRAARGALALAKGAPAEQPVAIGITAGPVSLVALHDALHGDMGHSLVPGDTQASAAALRDLCRSRQWWIACTRAVADRVVGSVALEGQARAATGEVAYQIVSSVRE